MQVAVDLLEDPNLTVIAEWLSEDDFDKFKRAVRVCIKADM